MSAWMRRWVLVCGAASVFLVGSAAGRTQVTGTAASAEPQSEPTAMGGKQMQTGGISDVQSGAMPRAKAETSTALTLTVEGRTQTLTIKQLETMPQRTVTVQNGHTQAQEAYTGVAVSDLLAQAGVTGDAQAVRARVLRSYLRATGTDFYFVVYSGVEIMGSMHTGEVIVALRRNGQRLGDAGELMLVSSEDKVPARWVHNLTSMTLTGVN